MQPGKIIIVYDFDESVSCRVATVMVQRRIDNLFMLSGGKHASWLGPQRRGKPQQLGRVAGGSMALTAMAPGLPPCQDSGCLRRSSLWA
jgi:hypothetical protein